MAMLEASVEVLLIRESKNELERSSCEAIRQWRAKAFIKDACLTTF